MRLLKFNNKIVDIDDNTAIGIDFQGYDIKDPGSRKVTVSNTFTIPKTSYNMFLIGHAGDPQSLSNDVYEQITVQYYNGNKQLIRNGSARVTEVSDRISVFVFEKDSMWTLMSDYLWPDFLSEFINWMYTAKGLPSASDPFTGTFQSFVEGYIATTEGLFLPFYISNLALYSPDEVSYLEDISKLYLNYFSSEGTIGLGGHFSIYCKTIFEFIEYKYGVDLSVTSEDYDYNIFQDEIAKKFFIPARNIAVEHSVEGFYFSVDLTNLFLPEDNSDDKESKSLYDFTKAFFQHFNCLIDKKRSNSEGYVIRRLDDLGNAPIVEFSGKLSGTYTFKPVLDSYKQVNYIKHESIYEDGPELLNAKKIVCLNKNIEAGGTDNDLFTIDNYIPKSVVLGGDVCPDLSDPDSFKTFVFFITQGQASTTVRYQNAGVEVSASVVLKIAKNYSLESEYNTIAAMVARPKMYTVKRYLSLVEIDKLQYFARYRIKELNGLFFINKISGFNPDKSTEPTTLELIKLP